MTGKRGALTRRHCAPPTNPVRADEEAGSTTADEEHDELDEDQLNSLD
jgi:hypothetical protein